MKFLLSNLKVTAWVFITVMYLVGTSCAMFKKTEDIDLSNEARTTDELIDDSQLEKSLEKLLKNTSDQFSKANINVVVNHGWVLLVGEVPHENMLEQAAQIVGNVGGVIEVHNYLSVDDNRTLLESAHDNWLKLKVRNHLGIDPAFPSQKIMVHTEKGVVYLMGQISLEHVSHAVIEAKEVKGVQKVVTIFEVLDKSN
ncbi:MAG: BON domain-containing protein [Saccharospirillaceae bacterium]|nr:BON domain-containing protein [Pseudomonadales bacterium]NRB80115.1 BON domain-containing protein [Saccharospirillaceae bacterium]